MTTRSKNIIKFAAVSLLLAAAFMADIILGSVAIDPKAAFSSLTEQDHSQAIYNIIVNFRLPKALTAALCGASLSAAGLLMQTLFRNPLAGPYVLGISSGSSLAVAILVLAAGSLSMPAAVAASGLGTVIAAVIGAVAVMLLVMLTSIKVKDSVTLLVAGMMFGSLAGAIVNVLQSVSNPDSLKIFVVWTMGSLSAVSWNHMMVMAPVLIAGMIMALLLQKPLNALLLGENYALGLGISVKKARAAIITATCLLAGASTAFTGPIAFIGVAVPHIARGIFKTTDHKVIMPATLLCGAALLLLCDIASQLPGTGYTLPINSVSSIVGVPIILFVIFKNKKLAS